MNLVVGMSAAWITTRTNMARDADRFQGVTQTVRLIFAGVTPSLLLFASSFEGVTRDKMSRSCQS